MKAIKGLIKNILNKKAPQSGAFLFLNFLFFSSGKEPWKIHKNPKKKKDRNTADEIKFFSGNRSKKFKNRVSRGSVKEEEVRTDNFVKKINRNTFAKKKQKDLRKPFKIRPETARN